MIFRFLERLFLVVLLLSSMHIMLGLTRAENNPNVASSSTALHMSDIAIEAGIDGCGAVLILLRWRKVIRAARAVWPLAGLTALALASVAWSADPMLTLRRSLLLVTSTLLAIYLGERYTTDQLARLLTQVMCIMMMAVIAFYFVSPSYVVESSGHVGAWKGLSV